jgi:hypothetical protein
MKGTVTPKDIENQRTGIHVYKWNWIMDIDCQLIT